MFSLYEMVRLIGLFFLDVSSYGRLVGHQAVIICYMLDDRPLFVFVL